MFSRANSTFLPSSGAVHTSAVPKSALKKAPTSARYERISFVYKGNPFVQLHNLFEKLGVDKPKPQPKPGKFNYRIVERVQGTNAMSIS